MKTSLLFSVLFFVGLVTNDVVRAQVPYISTVTPDSGRVGDTITISGGNFGSSYTQNIVYFGATKGIVIPGSTTSVLHVQLDSGASYAPVSILDTSTHKACIQQSAFFRPGFKNDYFIQNTINYLPFFYFFTGNTNNVPITAAIGDLDGDGKPDLAVNCRGNGAYSGSDTGALVLFLNTSHRGTINSSSFATAVSLPTGYFGSYPENVKIADIDGDGKPDIILSFQGSLKFVVFRNTSTVGSLSFSTGVTIHSPHFNGSSVLAIADFDGDGRLDVAVSSVDTNNFIVFRNISTAGSITTGSFDSGTVILAGARNLGICAADFDGDSKPDIAVVDTVNNLVSLFRNTSTTGVITFATRSTYTTGTIPTDVQAADINGDGKMDLIISDQGSNTLTVLQNASSTGTINFDSRVAFTTGAGPIGVAAGDFDGDGKVDVVVSNAAVGTVWVFRNTCTVGATISSSSFASPLPFSAGVVPLGVTVGDLDGDGYPEIITGHNTNGKIAILQNYPLPYVPPIAGDTSICLSAGTTTFSDSVTGGSWSVSNTSLATIDPASGAATLLSGGRDTIYYTITKGGDTNRIMTTLRIDSYVIPLGSITGSTSECPGASDTLRNVLAGGRWSSSAGTSGIATVDSVSGVVHGVAAGTTVITYTFTNSCTSADTTKTFTVDVGPAVGTISGPTGTICPGYTVTLTDTPSSGSWSSSDTTVAKVNSSTGVVLGIATGHATIIYSLTNSCGTTTNTRSVTVSITPSAGTVTGTTATICQGSTTTFSDTATGGYWTSSNTSIATVNSSGLVTGVSGGAVTISYSDSSSCGHIAVATKALSVTPTPVVGLIGGATGVCIGSSTTLTDTSTLGSWSSSNTAVATINSSGSAHGLSAGTTTIRNIVSNSCGSDTASLSFTVAAPAVSGTITGPATICIGTPSSFTESTSGGSWSSSATSVATVNASGLVTPVAAGSVTISYTVTNSCSSSTAVLAIAVSTAPVVGPVYGITAACPGVPLSLTDSVSGGTWTSSNPALATIGSTSGVFTGLSTSGGTDTVIYTITTGCGSAVKSAPVTINPAPDAGSITGAASLCVGSNTTYTATIGGGSWTSGNSAIASVNSSTGVVSGAGAGSTGISYTVSNSCGSAIISNSITVLTTPVATITGPASTNLCVNSSIHATGTPAGGTWRRTNSRVTFGAHTASGSTDSLLITGGTAGADTLTYVVTNICASDTSLKKIIQVQPLADTGIITGPSFVCVGGSITLADTASGGFWGDSIGASRAFIDPTTGELNATNGGEVIVTYRVASAFCGILQATHIVEVLNLPYAGVINGFSNICPGGVDTLTDPTGPITGLYWLSSNTAVVTIGLTTGYATGVATDSAIIYGIDTSTGQCGADTAFFMLHVHPGTPDAGIIFGTDTVCMGATFTLSDSISGGSWSSSDSAVAIISPSGFVTTPGAGTAIASYTLSNSCGTGHATLPIRVFGFPNLSSGANPAAICDSVAFKYTITSDSTLYTYTWKRALANGISNPSDSGTTTINEFLTDTTNVEVYAKYVCIINYHGCISIDTVTASIKPTPYLTTPLTDTVCSGIPFTYADNISTGAGSAATWSLVTFGHVTGTPASGTNGINEVLTSDTLVPENVLYLYTVSYNGCSSTEQLRVTVNPSPAPPQITIHSPASLCNETEYMNFGAATAPAFGTSYVWSATGAEVWATGDTKQYSLVNFNTSGTATIYLSAIVDGNNCSSGTSYLVSVGSAISDNPEVIYFNSEFICTSNTEDTYQWGYDDAGTLDSTSIAGQTNQNYYSFNPDFTHNHYWVITTHNGCIQKSYFNPPASVQNVNAAGGADLKIIPNPSNGSFTLNLESPNTEKATLVFSNLVGEVIKAGNIPENITTNKDITVQVNVPDGMYLITVVTPTGKYTKKLVITQ